MGPCLVGSLQWDSDGFVRIANSGPIPGTIGSSLEVGALVYVFASPRYELA